LAVKGLLAAGASKAGLGVIGAGLGAYGAYTEGSTAIHHFRQGNYFQGVFHTFTAGASAFGGYQASAPVRAATANFVRAHPRLNPANYSVTVDTSYLNSIGSLKGLKIRYNAPRSVGHHSIPKEIQKKLPEHTRSHPDVRGRRGNPNIKQVDPDKHVQAHDKTGISRKDTGIGGGRYNLRFQEEIRKRGGYDNVTPKQINEIRDRLMEEFGL